MDSTKTRKLPSLGISWRRVTIVVVISATFFAFIYSIRNLVGNISAGRPIDWGWNVYYEFIYWYVWAAFTPLILWFAGRFDPDQCGRRRAAFALLAFGLLVAPLQAGLENGLALVSETLRNAPNLGLWHIQHLPRSILLETFGNFVIYLLIVAAYYGYQYYRKYRERKLRSVELEARLAQAELHSLKMQLQPHFLFNTLNAISVLMMRDPEAANQMLLRLSDLLRLSLDQVGTQEVPLQQELDFLSGYLEIEQTRFQDRLTVSMDIEPATVGAAVPNLLLQPLVENAVRHGIAKRIGAGHIDIRASRVGANLRLEVQDNGIGLRNDVTSNAGGVGLTNSRARLERLYGSRYQFDVKNVPGGGVLVTVIMPFSRLSKH
jgi:two-component system LytT family sensor kinase